MSLKHINRNARNSKHRMKNFSKDYLIEILNACKGHDIFHTDKKPGIIIRHDIDDNFQRSYNMSVIEDSIGVKATYFVLNGRTYFNDPYTFMGLRLMQERGHEIGWHNNALTQWYKDKSQDLFAIIRKPIDKLRSEGLSIIGAVAHGNRKKDGYHNYQIWDISSTSKQYPGIGNKQFSLGEFGLTYDGMLTVEKDYYVNDNSKTMNATLFSGGGSESITNEHGVVPIIQRCIKENKRMILSLHPQHWDI